MTRSVEVSLAPPSMALALMSARLAGERKASNIVAQGLGTWHGWIFAGRRRDDIVASHHWTASSEHYAILDRLSQGAAP